jgi:diacylglycerol kinase family enzyme
MTLVGVNDGSQLTALVFYLSNTATLQYDPSRQVCDLTIGCDIGERRVLVSVPIASVINIETRNERLQREAALPTSSARPANTKEQVKEHGDADETGCFGRPFGPRGSETPAAIASSEAESGPKSPPQLYFMHFAPIKAKTGKDVRTISFCARAGSEDALARLVSAVNTAVYRTGAKTIVAFISPVSGSGKAQSMWNDTVYGVLRYSKHRIQPIITTHRFHCEEYIADPKNDLSDAHVVVAVGGDGMMHEAVNGLDQRRRAIGSRPNYSEPLLATVPAGSGCAMAKAFCILEPIQAAMAMVHLEAVTIDLMRITFINTERVEPQTKEEKKNKSPVRTTMIDASGIAPRVSFLNVALGLTCEIDRGSEKWRWMGNARFTVYAGQLVVQGLRPYRIQIRYVPWKSKAMPNLTVQRMLPEEKFPASYQYCSHRDDCAQCKLHQEEKMENALLPINDEDWVTVPDDCHVMAMANNFQDAARDMAIAPYAHVADGSIDLVMAGSMRSESIGSISRKNFIAIFLGLEEGKHIHNSMVTYVKCRAVELKPLEGLLMSDGEVIATAGARVTTIPNGARIVRSR